MRCFTQRDLLRAVGWWPPPTRFIAFQRCFVVVAVVVVGVCVCVWCTYLPNRLPSDKSPIIIIVFPSRPLLLLACTVVHLLYANITSVLYTPTCKRLVHVHGGTGVRKPGQLKKATVVVE